MPRGDSALLLHPSVPTTRKPLLLLCTETPGLYTVLACCHDFLVLSLFLTHQPITVEDVLLDANVILSTQKNPGPDGERQHLVMRDHPKKPDFKNVRF